jgi:hypothetical protein
MQEPKKPASPISTAPHKLTDFEIFGLPEPVAVDEDREEDRPDWYNDWLSSCQLKEDFPVYAESWPAVEIFCFCQHQWRHGFNGITGLDYTAVMAVIAPRYPHLPDQVEMLDDIHWLEHGAMVAFNEIRKTAEDKAEAERKRR